MCWFREQRLHQEQQTKWVDSRNLLQMHWWMTFLKVHMYVHKMPPPLLHPTMVYLLGEVLYQTQQVQANWNPKSRKRKSQMQMVPKEVVWICSQLLLMSMKRRLTSLSWYLLHCRPIVTYESVAFVLCQDIYSDGWIFFSSLVYLLLSISFPLLVQWFSSVILSKVLFSFFSTSPTCPLPRLSSLGCRRNLEWVESNSY